MKQLRFHLASKTWRQQFKSSTHCTAQPFVTILNGKHCRNALTMRVLPHSISLRSNAALDEHFADFECEGTRAAGK
jgi:hypothetical protein